MQIAASLAEQLMDSLEPLAQDGNPFACLYKLKLLAAGDDQAAQQAVLDDLTAKMQGAVEVVRRFGEALARAFGGIDMSALAQRLAAITSDPEDVDQFAYDSAPEGCWATSDDDDDESCDVPAVDDLGLCARHRRRMATASP